MVEYVKNQAKMIASLHISWYGGEPLIAFDVIENLSKKFIEICEENNVNYSAGIVTNGYLLSDEILNKFETLKISFMQVTLDGTKEYHDSRRYLAGGQGTYDKIINNLILAKGRVANIAIRINTDKENSNIVTKVLDVLEEKDILKYVNPYLGYVESYNDCYSKESCLSIQDYSEIDIDFYNELKKRNVIVSKLSKYPRRVFNYCGADKGIGFVIDNKGDLYKCWNDIGRVEYSFGNIVKGVITSNYVNKLLLYDPTVDKECKDCKFITVCMGGCPNRRLNNMTGKCVEHKFNMEKYLKIVTSNLLNHE